MERKERQESHTPLAKEEGDSRGRDTEERKQDLRGIPTYPLHFQGMCEHTCTYTGAETSGGHPYHEQIHQTGETKVNLELAVSQLFWGRSPK